MPDGRPVPAVAEEQSVAVGQLVVAVLLPQLIRRHHRRRRGQVEDRRQWAPQRRETRHAQHFVLN